MPAKTTDWIVTKTQFLYRHRESGRYYCRAYAQGREVWRSLGTNSYEVAKHELKKKLSEIHRTRNLEAATTGKDTTFGSAGELWLDHIKTATDTKASTKATTADGSR